jgi:type III pantothenate kinase
MIVIDIGNTNIVIGIVSNQKIKKTIRLNTKEKKLIIELYKYFKFRDMSNYNLDFRVCIISSVSTIPEKIIMNFFKALDFKIFNINTKNIPKIIKFNYNYNQLGADRIANTFAAIENYGKNSLVVDFGTATTFDVVINNVYQGGLISPGINISHDALVFNASKLSKISISKITKIVCNDTKSSMQSGFYWGYVSLINGVIKKIIAEKKFKPKIIITGGLAKTFEAEIKYTTYYEPNLTLDGLYLIGKIKYAS